MSGTTGLGSLLATRLDAVMGTTLAQHPVALDGKAGANVAQPAQHLHGQDSTIRRATEEVGARTGQADARQVQARGGAAEAARAAAQALPQSLLSARTLLSEPAQTILALLLSNLQGKAALQGRFPLLPLPPAAAQAGRGPAADGATPGRGGGAGAGTATGAAPGGAGSAAAATTPGASPTSGAAAGSAGGSGGTAASAAGPGASAGAGTASAAATAAQASGGARPAGSPGLPGALASTALPPAPPGMAPAMAAALQQTVTQSGLFYESHLAQMAFGQRDASEVLREPQARLPQPGSAPATATSPGAAPTAAPAGSAAAATAAGLAAASTAATPPASTQVTLSSAAASAAGSAALAGIHPDAIPLVRQQLEALANQAFAWQGEAWNGAAMDWEVQRREPDEGQAAALASWATRLRLQLPRLGEVEARLLLANNQLVLRLVAPDSAPLLQHHLAALRDRLVSQGLQLTDTAVSRTAQAAGGTVERPA